MRNISVTNASNGASKDYYHTLAEGIILCSAFVVEVVLIAVGNLLTVVLFAFNRKLRRKSLFLVINMAFSEAMLGTVCLPLYVYLIAGPTFQLWENAYELQMRLDIVVHVLHTIFTHSSLISAVFISFERFYAIYWPLKHRGLSVREYFIIILTTWVLAIIVCAVHNAEHYFHLGLSFYGWVLFPLVFLSAVCVLNIGILMKFHGGGLGSITLQQQNRSAQNMKRLTKTLLFTSMTAILSWLPLLIGNCLVADHEVYIPPHSYWLYVILMNYTNSIVNPVLYVLRISEFRSSLLLLCLRRPVVVRGEERGKQRDDRSDLSAHAVQLETSKEEIIDTKFWNGGMASSSCSISNRTRSLPGPKLLLFGDRPWNKWQKLIK